MMPESVAAILAVPTPRAWLEEAVARLPEVLNDHANCELKAASTALGFLYRYPERTSLVQRMSRLAREELRHFEQVRRLMADTGVSFERLSASRYAGALREKVRDGEPEKLTDMLLIGALIEARSCERFAALAPVLPAEISPFYARLIASEARHFEQYTAIARTETGLNEQALGARIRELQRVEAELITAPDPQFRFHSGTPAH